MYKSIQMRYNQYIREDFRLYKAGIAGLYERYPINAKNEIFL